MFFQGQEYVDTGTHLTLQNQDVRYVTQAMAFAHCAINPILYVLFWRDSSTSSWRLSLRKACWGETQCQISSGICQEAILLLKQGLWSLEDHTSEILDLAHQTLHPSVVFVLTATAWESWPFSSTFILRGQDSVSALWPFGSTIIFYLFSFSSLVPHFGLCISTPFSSVRKK